MTSRGMTLLPPNARIAVYGLGSRGRTFMELVRQHAPSAQVVCYIDSFKADPDHTPRLVMVDDIDTCGIAFDTLVVASSFYGAIILKLLEKGYKPDFFFHDNGLTTYPEGSYPGVVSYESKRIRSFIQQFGPSQPLPSRLYCPAKWTKMHDQGHVD